MRIMDCSSDVCSSDLGVRVEVPTPTAASDSQNERLPNPMTSPQAPVTPGAATLPSGLSSKSRRQRRWSLALAGVLLILGSGMVFLLVFVNAGDREPVLAIAREVPAGQVISGADLQIVRVGADPGVSTISEARRS